MTVSGSEDNDQEETLECLVSRAHEYTKIIICLLVPVFYPGSLWALAGCFPQAIVNVIFLWLQVHWKTLVTVRVMVILTSTHESQKKKSIDISMFYKVTIL